MVLAAVSLIWGVRGSLHQGAVAENAASERRTNVASGITMAELCDQRLIRDSTHFFQDATNVARSEMETCSLRSSLNLSTSYSQLHTRSRILDGVFNSELFFHTCLPSGYIFHGCSRTVSHHFPTLSLPCFSGCRQINNDCITSPACSLAQGVGVFFSLLPASLFEHFSADQAVHPPKGTAMSVTIRSEEHRRYFDSPQLAVRALMPTLPLPSLHVRHRQRDWAVSTG